MPHSVVQGADGHRFDITPFGGETIRRSVRFVPHIGSETEFFRYKDLFPPHMTCENEASSPSPDLEEMGLSFLLAPGDEDNENEDFM